MTPTPSPQREEAKRKEIYWPGSAAFATDEAARWAFEVTAELNKVLATLEQEVEEDE